MKTSRRRLGSWVVVGLILGFGVWTRGAADKARVQYVLTKGQLAILEAHHAYMDAFAAQLETEIALRRDTFAPTTVRKLENALALYRKAAEARRNLDPPQDDPQVHFGTGWCLFHLGRFAEAIEQFSAALGARPGWREADAHLGLAYAKMGRNREAADAFKRAFRVHPYDREANLGWESWLTGGRERFIAKVLEAALRAQPNDAEVHHALGCMYERLGRDTDSLEQHFLSVEARPDDAVLHWYVAASCARQPESVGEFYLLFLGKGEPLRVTWAKVAEEYEAAIRLNPDYAEAHDGVVTAYRKLGRWEDARRERQSSLKSYRERTAKNPKDSYAHYGLGKVYVGLGDREGALREYKALKPLDTLLASNLLRRIEYPRLATVKTRRAVIRGSPGSGEVFFRPARGTTLVLLYDDGNNYAVLMQDGRVGWIARGQVVLGRRL